LILHCDDHRQTLADESRLHCQMDGKQFRISQPKRKEEIAFQCNKPRLCHANKNWNYEFMRLQTKGENMSSFWKAICREREGGTNLFFMISSNDSGKKEKKFDMKRRLLKMEGISSILFEKDPLFSISVGRISFRLVTIDHGTLVQMKRLTK